MAKGKSQYATWYCPECNQILGHSYYDKRRDSEITKTLSRFCSNCGKHMVAKRKDTKKGN